MEGDFHVKIFVFLQEEERKNPYDTFSFSLKLYIKPSDFDDNYK